MDDINPADLELLQLNSIIKHVDGHKLNQEEQEAFDKLYPNGIPDQKFDPELLKAIRSSQGRALESWGRLKEKMGIK